MKMDKVMCKDCKHVLRVNGLERMGACIVKFQTPKSVVKVERSFVNLKKKAYCVFFEEIEKKP